MSVDSNNKTASAFSMNHSVVIEEPGPLRGQRGQATTTTTHLAEEELQYTKSSVKLPWQLTIWAWVLLAIEVVVMGALYLNGGGRVAAWVLKDGVDASAPLYIENFECENGAGSPAIAKSVALRAATAVCTQLVVVFISDRGLLKPYEAMWVIFASFMRCWGVPNFYCGAIITIRDSNGHERETAAITGAWFLHAGLWVCVPVIIIYLFTGLPARYCIAADCDLAVDGTVAYWFNVSYLVFMSVCVLLLSCFSDRETEAIDPYARAFVVLDSITIGIAFVWGNYVQSGVVAGVFGLLPAFNLYLAYREYRLMFEARSDPPTPNSPRITEA